MAPQMRQSRQDPNPQWNAPSGTWHHLQCTQPPSLGSCAPCAVGKELPCWKTPPNSFMWLVAISKQNKTKKKKKYYSKRDYNFSWTNLESQRKTFQPLYIWNSSSSPPSPSIEKIKKKKKGGSVQHQSGVVFCVPSNPWKAFIVSQSLMDTDKTEQDYCKGNLFLSYDLSVNII